MGGTEGQVAQISPCLAPMFMVNTQHQVEHCPAGKPSYGNRHRHSKHPNYGSQTGRGLAAAHSRQLVSRWPDLVLMRPLRPVVPPISADHGFKMRSIVPGAD